MKTFLLSVLLLVGACAASPGADDKGVTACASCRSDESCAESRGRSVCVPSLDRIESATVEARPLKKVSCRTAYFRCAKRCAPGNIDCSTACVDDYIDCIS